MKALGELSGSAQGPQGVRGARGAKGRQGRRGVPGRSMSRRDVLDIVAEQFSTVRLRLENQLARSAQLQDEVNKLRRDLIDMKHAVELTQDLLLRAVVTKPE